MGEILNSAIVKIQNAKYAFCRFITANDTGKNGSHQAGFYIPKCAAALLFDTPGVKGENKDKMVKVKWQDDFTTDSRFIYYGQGTRNEYRITRFGKGFPFFEEDNVGDLLIIAQQSEDYYYGFVLQTDQDIDDFFAYFNLSPEKTNQLIDVTQASTPEKQLEIGIQELVALYADFPETRQMAQFARDIYNKVHHITDVHICKSPDEQLLKWIDTEYGLFRSFEEKVYAPIYSVPFPNCQELVKFSNIILNRRKSRAGKSLEHHLATIFTAAQLEYEEQAVTEDNKKPDFLFPNGEAYHNMLFPAKKGVLHLVGSDEVVPVHNLLIMLTDTHTHLVQFAVHFQGLHTLTYHASALGVPQIWIGSCLATELRLCSVHCDTSHNWNSTIFLYYLSFEVEDN